MMIIKVSKSEYMELSSDSKKIMIANDCNYIYTPILKPKIFNWVRTIIWDSNENLNYKGRL